MSNRLWWVYREQLNAVGDGDLNRLQGAMHSAKYDSGKTVYSCALPGDVIYWVQRGQLVVSEETPAGFWREVDILRAGDVFGSLSLIESGFKKGRVIALGDVSMLVMRKGAFEKMMRFFPGTGARWVAFLQAQQELIMRVSYDVGFFHVVGRLKRLLGHYLDNPAYVVEGEPLEFTCDVKALARQLAAPPYVVERALETLEEQREIQREDRVISRVNA